MAAGHVGEKNSITLTSCAQKQWNNVTPDYFLYFLQGWKICVFGHYPRPKDTNKLCGSTCKEGDTRQGAEATKIPWLLHANAAIAATVCPKTIGQYANGDH